MISRNPLFGIAFALMLAFSSLGMAVTRSQATAGSELVICSGAGFATVTLDPKGNPIGPTHPCPYCLAAHIAALLPDPAVLPIPEPGVVVHTATVLPKLVSLAPPPALARGPPMLL